MLYTIAGHSYSDSGAIAYNGEKESYYTIDLVRRINLFYPQVIIDDPRWSLTEVANYINSTSLPGDYCLDVHFNNNIEGASGSEVFVHPNTTYRNKIIAGNLGLSISGELNIPLRQSSPERLYKFDTESNRKKLYLVRNVTIPVIVLEVCFLNKNDMNKYIGKENEVAKIIVNTYKYV